MKILKLLFSFFKTKSTKNVNVDENLWEPNIHPLYIQMKENATLCLLKNGFSIFNGKKGIETFKNNSDIYISVVNQGYDFPEVYIGKSYLIGEMIRFDYMLELFLTGKTELIKKHKLLNNFYDFEYEKEFIETYYESILKINPFPEQYNEWMASNDKLIRSFTS